jgi:hypothetical protein
MMLPPRRKNNAAILITLMLAALLILSSNPPNERLFADNISVTPVAEWNLNAEYGVSQSGFANAIRDAKQYLIDNPHDTLIIRVDPGTYPLSNYNGNPNGIIDVSNIKPGSPDGRLIFQGGGQEGAKATTLVFEDSVSSIYGRNVYQVAFQGFHMTRPALKVSQGIVVSSAPGSVTLDIQSGFPSPHDIFDDWTQGRYVRAYDNTNPLDPQIIGFEAWPPPRNPQIAWKTAEPVDGHPDRWTLYFNNKRQGSEYKPGDLIGIKSKHGGQAYWFASGSDFVFEDIMWTGETRGVFRGGFDHIRISDCMINRADPINGQAPALSSPGGGPQIGQPNDPPVTDVVVENCYIEGTGDDAVGFFNATGVLRNTVIHDAFTRLLLYNSPGIRLEGNTLIRTPIFYDNPKNLSEEYDD